MAAKLVQRPIPSSQVVPQIPSVTKMMRVQRPFSATHPKIARFGEHSSGFKPIKVAEQTGIEDQPPELRTPTQIKARLYEAVEGINRGIFGVQSGKKSEIEGLVKLLESQNPITEPSVFLKKVGGRWRLVYSTITILGSKRTKLGLRDFIELGDFYQTIDTAERKAVNVIEFNARGINFLNGQLKIEASFQIASKSRVDINYTNSTISPDQLMNLFQKNYDLLLSIFNPEGWLDTTYVDDTLRIGRDDRGNVFILERPEEENQA